MTLEEFVFRRLADDVAIAALVGTAGSPAGGRIYPVLADQAAHLPYVVFQSVGDTPESDIAGGSVQRTRLQIVARAVSFDGAAALADAVRDVFKSLDATVTGWGRVTAVCVLQNVDLFDDAPRSFARATDFRFIHP